MGGGAGQEKNPGQGREKLANREETPCILNAEGRGDEERKNILHRACQKPASRTFTRTRKRKLCLRLQGEAVKEGLRDVGDDEEGKSKARSLEARPRREGKRGTTRGSGVTLGSGVVDAKRGAKAEWRGSQWQRREKKGRSGLRSKEKKEGKSQGCPRGKKSVGQDLGEKAGRAHAALFSEEKWCWLGYTSRGQSPSLHLRRGRGGRSRRGKN